MNIFVQSMTPKENEKNIRKENEKKKEEKRQVNKKIQEQKELYNRAEREWIGSVNLMQWDDYLN
jgi:hypothetical protein